MKRKRGEAAAPAASRRTDAATRVRLMALDAGHGTVELGGRSACVYAPGREGRRSGETIAHAVIGPRAPDIDGYVDIAGQRIDLASLPTPLLRPSAPRTIDARMLGDIWQSICAPRRAQVAKAHAARRLERHRTIAAIERAHERVAPVAAIARSEEPVPPAEIRVEQDETVRDVQLLVDAIDRLVPVPSSEALRVASELEYLLANPPVDAPAGIDLSDLEALEAELAAARATVADIAGVIPAAVRQRVAQCHYDVMEAEGALFKSGRKNRDVALARYQEALTREREALAEAGVDSYVAFLVAIVAGVGAAKPAQGDLQVRLRAEIELAQAEAAVEAARKQIGVLPPAEHALRKRALELQATVLLGHAPGDDPVAELCAVRVAHPDADDLREQLRRRLDALGVDGGDDVVSAAHAFMRERRAAHAESVVAADAAAETSASSPDDEQDLDVALATLLEQRAEHDAALAAMEAELEVLDTQRARPVSQLAPAGVTLVIATLLERYRDGQLLAGRLPMVIDRAFDAFDESRASAAGALLAQAEDVQVIVVTQHAAVADMFGASGAPKLQWPQPNVEADEPVPAEVHAPEPHRETVVTALWVDEAAATEEPEPIVAMCAEHPKKVSAAACAHCERGCCIECLVYVPLEAALWCTACVHEVRPNDLRAANS
jgi:hypothetical protein